MGMSGRRFLTEVTYIDGLTRQPEQHNTHCRGPSDVPARARGVRQGAMSSENGL